MVPSPQLAAGLGGLFFAGLSLYIFMSFRRLRKGVAVLEQRAFGAQVCASVPLLQQHSNVGVGCRLALKHGPHRQQVVVAEQAHGGGTAHLC